MAIGAAMATCTLEVGQAVLVVSLIVSRSVVA